MEDVRVPHPNPFVTQWLVGEECHALVQAKTEAALALYVDIVHIRTGRLAESARAETFIGGVSRSDRWSGRLIITAPYAASHEYGTGREDPRHIQQAAHDLNTVLNLMAAL